MLRDALTFPFRGESLAFVGLGTLLCSLPPVVASLLPALPYVEVVGAIVEGLVLCYMLIYFHGVLKRTARGEEHLPMWPEEADWAALAGRAFYVLEPLLLSFLPLIAFVVWRVFATGKWLLEGAMLWTAGGLFVLGFLYLPIALLIFSFYGETAVLNVVGAVRSIARIGWGYFPVAGFLLGLFGAYAALAAWVVGWPLVLWVPVAAFLFFCCMIAAMRAVGLLYARHREALGWEDAVKQRH